VCQDDDDDETKKRKEKDRRFRQTPGQRALCLSTGIRLIRRQRVSRLRRCRRCRGARGDRVWRNLAAESSLGDLLSWSASEPGDLNELEELGGSDRQPTKRAGKQAASSFGLAGEPAQSCPRGAQAPLWHGRAHQFACTFGRHLSIGCRAATTTLCSKLVELAKRVSWVRVLAGGHLVAANCFRESGSPDLASQSSLSVSVSIAINIVSLATLPLGAGTPLRPLGWTISFWQDPLQHNEVHRPSQGNFLNARTPLCPS